MQIVYHESYCEVIKTKIEKDTYIKAFKNKNQYIDKLVDVISSWIIEEFDNYNSSLYYENLSYILECYKEGRII